MNTLESASAHSSTGHTLKPVHFYLDAPQARLVQIVGDFSLGTPVPLLRRVDGWWYVQVLLTHGHHPYRFLVDGAPTLDPQATGTTLGDNGEPWSLVAVS